MTPSMNPPSADLVAYGESLFGVGQMRAAACLFEHADPSAEDLALTLRLATCYLGTGEPARGVERLERGAASHGWTSEVWHLYAVALGASGRLQEAIEAAEVAARD